MRRFFDNKLAFFAVAVLFAFALTWNFAHGADTLLGTHLLMAPTWMGGHIAHGPQPPCTDCVVAVAHGPQPPCTDCVVTRIG
jgi:hypothetical protein